MEKEFKKILKNFNEKKIKVGVIGLGYVGLPLAIKIVEKNFLCYGFDIDISKLRSISSGKSYINYIDNKKIKYLLKSKKFFCYSNFKKISDLDIIILCLPTPINNNKNPDITILKRVFKSIFNYLKHNQLIILESTTYPGTTEELFVPKLKKRFELGENFFLGYSPEREDPGNKKYKLSNIPKVTSGYSKKCQVLVKKFYKLLDLKVYSAKSLQIAETSKLLENTYRSINIALINQIKFFCDKMKINIFDVIDAAKTKPFGFQAFYPGPGYGGHCIPVDPNYLKWKGKKLGLDLSFITLANKINDQLQERVSKKINDFINKKKLKKKILIVGVSYKKNINDIRNSPALKIIYTLKRKEYDIDYLDPYVSKLKIKKFEIKRVSYTNKLISQYSAICILSDHDKINYKSLLKYSKVIFDTRGRYKLELDKKIISI
jgi:UDP-N-acetyl-D-glucosamine dehydrogenase